ncbi:MAG: phosphatidylglycerophosphatase A [Pseudomonadota bacterium]
MKLIIKMLANGFYLGHIPVGPGTFGSLIGVLIYYFICRWLSIPMQIVTFIPFFFLSVWVSNEAIKIYNDEDPKQVVIDEVAGILITYLAHPFSWKMIIVGFILFRFFDILKPFPIKRVEKIFPGGWGIVMDDIVAGIFANFSLWVIFMIIKL